MSGSVRPKQDARILGIPGSLRKASYNRRLLAVAAELGPCGQLTIWNGLHSVPPFNEDQEVAPPQAVLALREAIAGADAVLIATPEYNGSLPGQLKNALDWASRPYATNVLRDKPVAVIGASPSPGGTARANTEARRILERIGAQVLEARLLVPRAFDELTGDGLADRRLGRQLAEVVSALLEAAGQPSELVVRAA